jgi:hypothetical protein
MRVNILKEAQAIELQIESIEMESSNIIIRNCSVNKLEEFRTHLLNVGHVGNISCHREHGSSEAFMLIWHN